MTAVSEGAVALMELVDLHVGINETSILKGIDLRILPGEVHALWVETEVARLLQQM